MKARPKMDRHTQLMERVYIELVQETMLNEGLFDKIKGAFGGKVQSDPLEMRAIKEIGEFIKSNGRFFYELAGHEMDESSWYKIASAIKNFREQFQYTKAYKNMPSINSMDGITSGILSHVTNGSTEIVKLQSGTDKQLVHFYDELKKEFAEVENN